MSNENLSEVNWQRAAVLALEGLPDDIKSSCGLKYADNAVVVTVATESVQKKKGFSIQEIVIRRYENQIEAMKDDEGNFVSGYNDPEYNAELLKKNDRPLITVDQPGGDRNGFFVGNCPIGYLSGRIISDILDTLFQSGVLSKDDSGSPRYFREDSTEVVASI